MTPERELKIKPETKGATTIEEKNDAMLQAERGVLRGTIKGVADAKQIEANDEKAMRDKFKSLSRKRRRNNAVRELFGFDLKKVTTVEAKGIKLDRKEYRRLRKKGKLS